MQTSLGMGKNWITKSLHQRSRSGVAVLGPVRPLMEDTLSKLSEHVRLCVEQIIVPYLGMILLNCFSKMFKIVQIIVVIVFAR